MPVLQHPRDYQRAIDDLLIDCHKDLVNLLIENGGVWVKADDDTDYIVMKQWLGSPIICSLKVDGNDVTTRTRFMDATIYFRGNIMGGRDCVLKMLSTCIRSCGIN